jgi:hypothetical protein
MREIEEAYFSGKTNIDAKQMLTATEFALGLRNTKIIGWKETLKSSKKI